MGSSKINHRRFVGPNWRWDVVAANQFNLLTFAGLRKEHKLLDFGCGSLRAGRLFIPYLEPNCYYGIEPNKWLIDEAIEKEFGDYDLINLKNPSLYWFCAERQS